MEYPKYFKGESQLEEALSRPTPELIELMKGLEGDIIFLGVAGKMGISMAKMALRATEKANVKRRIIGVSRFTSPGSRSRLEENGIETIEGDLLDIEFVKSLPKAENVIYLAGLKFGTEGNRAATWAMNSYLPGLIVEKFKNSRIVALSTGCVYPLVKIDSGGSIESDMPAPIGEYAQSCLGRERLFEYGSAENNTKVLLIRLNYAVEMRYGVLVDIASKVHRNEMIDLTMGYVNVIWQGDANAMILRGLNVCKSPANHLNISGSETVSVAEMACKFGEIMGKRPRFTGTEADSALLSNVSKCKSLFGEPKVALDTVIEWTSEWIVSEKPLLGKSTHFETRDGKY